MSEHIATLSWNRGDFAFDYKSYSRNHSWDFGHGNQVIASAAAQFLGDETKVDPEQAFVASRSSCHMLTFLAIAAMSGLTVDKYEDRAVGHLTKNEARKMVISRVDLYPKILFADGQEPNREKLEKMHHKAHEECFLANSVNCEIITHLES